MMDSKIRQYADSGDLKSLKYIFMSALDADPTFQRYEEDYNYCKSVPGLLERHEELTPFVSDSSQWTEAYWTQLKMDLKKNFSDRRMCHMREVAQVLMADKIRRLTSERQAAAAAASRPAASARPAPAAGASASSIDRSALERQVQEANERKEAQRRADNERAAAAQAAQAKRLAEARQNLQKQQQTGSDFPKKAFGIALVLAAAAAVVLFLLLKGRNPA